LMLLERSNTLGDYTIYHFCYVLKEYLELLAFANLISFIVFVVC
jgi:hypothetical protein